MDLDMAGKGMTSERTRLRLIERLKQAGIRHTGVLQTIRDIPRHLFVDEALSHRAYEDTALPIGFGQTISQPYIVARMTMALLNESETLGHVLEIGTGSGYQTALLSCLCARVTTVERHAQLMKRAQQLLRRMHHRNVTFVHADGTNGYLPHAPYQGIIVTAAPSRVPASLLSQLADGGKMIIPVGPEQQAQELQVITRRGDQYHTISLELVRFVPLNTGLAT